MSVVSYTGQINFSQALQAEENENIEEGARIATELLGREKEHLYPKIFQLGMADDHTVPHLFTYLIL